MYANNEVSILSIISVAVDKSLLLVVILSSLTLSSTKSIFDNASSTVPVIDFPP